MKIQTFDGDLQGAALTFGMVALVGLMLFSQSVYITDAHQMMLGGVLLMTQYAAYRTVTTTGVAGRVFLLFLGLFLTSRYWVFRTTQTIGYNGLLDYAMAVALYMAETYGILIYVLGMFVNVWPLQRSSPPLPSNEEKLPTVDVYVPTYNEPVDMVRITVMACTQLFYPREKLNICILDDGGTRQKLEDLDPDKAQQAWARAEALKKIAEELGVAYLTRETNRNAKAGNINEALMRSEPRIGEQSGNNASGDTSIGYAKGGELILVLDCDHVPTRDFLQKTVGFFIEDDDLFLVQTPHFFVNPDPVEKNLKIHRRNPGENEMFYGVIQKGLDFWNASFFCGSAALLRRRHLLEAGGLSGQTITEDAETALTLHGRGYRSVYLPKPLVCGLSPETFDDFVLQRSRWAQGMTQIFMLKNPLWVKGLTLAQRLCYFNSCFFWFFGLARFTFFLAPLMLLFFGFRIYNASLAQVLVYAVPHLVSAHFISNFLFGKHRHPFFSELYEAIQSIYMVPAVISVFLRPRSPVFKVTPKAISLKEDFLSHLAAPFYALFLACITAYGFGVVRYILAPWEFDAIVLCLFWNTFNVILLLSCLGVVWEQRQLRGQHRYATGEPSEVLLPESGVKYSVTICDLSISGAGLEIPSDANIPEGMAVLLKARDSYGQDYQIPMRVVGVHNRRGFRFLGCRFQTDDLKERLQIVNFVYGDSSRWKYFHERSERPKVSNMRGMIYLLKIGLSGVSANAGGLMVRLYRSIKERIQTALLLSTRKERKARISR